MVRVLRTDGTTHLLQSLPPLNCSIIRGGLSFSDLYPVDLKDRSAIQRLYWSEVVAHVRRIFTGGSFQSSELSHLKYNEKTKCEGFPKKEEFK